MKTQFSYFINLLLILLVAYLLFMNQKDPVDLSGYERKIDSLNLALEANDKKLDSLNQKESKYEEDLVTLKRKLADLKNKNQKLQKQHDEEVNAINSMSNTDISTLFSETFE
jgi:septal ring factor EnvC (AmiA/AmiB activator)